MITELDLGRFRTVRIWEGELPPACFTSAAVISAAVPASGNMATRSMPSKFCVEYKAHLGGRISYGLLGSTFETSQDPLLSIEVVTKEVGWEIYSNTMYKGNDPILVGLPEVFGEGVLQSTLSFFGRTQSPIARGKLSFICAAFSEVGSSEDVFDRLSHINSFYHSSVAAYRQAPSTKELLAILD